MTPPTSSRSVDRFTTSLSIPEAMGVSHFVAREEELTEMHRILHQGPRRSIVAIHGSGGVGKTQLALAYLRRHRNDYTSVFWFNARDETSLRQSFHNAATGILQEHPTLEYMQTAVSNEKSDASIAVKRWLDELKNDRWLLIYDNYQPTCDSYDILSYLTGTDHGAAIVTTRSSTVELGNRLWLQKLQKVEDSLSILKTTSGRTGCEDDPSAVALARKLDGLPLALSTAGAHLSQVSTSWQQYLQAHETACSQLQELSPPLLTNENCAMYLTWNISYKSIRQLHEPAAMLLRLWAFFGNEDLWYELLRPGVTADGPVWLRHLTETRLAFDEGMRVLCSHGLVERKSTSTSDRAGCDGYSVHECVHSWMVQVLNDRIEEKGLAALAIKCVSSHVPEDGGMPKSHIIQRRLMLHSDRCRELLETADDEDGDSAHQLGSLYAHQGRQYADQYLLENAEEMFKQALKKKLKALGFCPSTYGTIFNLGNVYRDQERQGLAEVMFAWAVVGRKETLGRGHPLTLETLSNIGKLNADQRRQMQVLEPLLAKVIKWYEHHRNELLQAQDEDRKTLDTKEWDQKFFQELMQADPKMPFKILGIDAFLGASLGDSLGDSLDIKTMKDIWMTISKGMSHKEICKIFDIPHDFTPEDMEFYDFTPVDMGFYDSIPEDTRS